MLLFSQIALLVLTMVAPVIFLIVFAYVKAQGWKVIAWGIFLSLACLIILRMIIPLLFMQDGWFISLTGFMPLYVFVYSLCLSLLYLASGWLIMRRWKSSFYLSRAAVFGFCEGFAYEALFIGFNGLASLLSSNVEAVGADGIGGIWLSAIEAVCMLILFTGFAVWLFQGLSAAERKTKWLWILASFGGMFLLFYLGLSWLNVWHLPRAMQELLFMASAAAMAWYLFHHLSLRTFFSVEKEAEAYEYDGSEDDGFDLGDFTELNRH